MNLFRKMLLGTIGCFILLNLTAKPIKVACIGNSITFGYGLKNRDYTSYPNQLQLLLGDSFEVKNFGHSGSTLLNKGHNPYIKTPEYKQAIDFKADFVVIHLGINDTDPRNYPSYRDEFTKDYFSLIQDFKNINPNVKIWICKLTPIFPNHPRFRSSTLQWYDAIQKDIIQVAKSTNLPLIDLNTPFRTRNDLFEDAIHPNEKGAEILATTVYQNISGSFGGLKLDPIFTNHMVLQRNKPITIYGTGDKDSEITILLDNHKYTSKVNHVGKWEIKLPILKTGGPYNFIIKDNKTTLELSDVLVGDIWICSGQSNMAFKLCESSTYNTDIDKLDKTQIRLYNQKPIADTSNIHWELDILDKVNNDAYYNSTSWNLCTAETAKDFSAIGYYFANELNRELNVPIGIINNAIGGSTTESWLPRTVIEHTPHLVNLFYNWNNNDFIDSWVRGRAQTNTSNSNVKFQKHPYHPSYLFEAAIKPIENFPISGVIWYQGESNAHNVELHEMMLPILVKSWRETKQENFPFYFVQLSSISGRDTWAHFRDSQRRLARSIPNSGMIVSSDWGEKHDVHPKNKLPIAQRLASLALNKHYQLKGVKYSGPYPTKYTFKENEVVIEFGGCKSLETSNKDAVKTFEVAGEDRVFRSVEVLIKKNKAFLETSISKPKYVRYGWSAFSEGNLVDEKGIPASTFSNEFE